MSPVFAAMVLGEILKGLDQEFCERAARRKDQNSMDDNKGGVPIILAYVDDVNCLLPLEDVEDFLRRFKEIGEDLGAKMNTEKTRILTSTHNKSTVDKLLASSRIGLKSVGTSLQRAIKEFSNKTITGTTTPYEVTNGLRVLGVPIGSSSFCKDFIKEQVHKMQSDGDLILAGLDDPQTQLQLFKTCTAHKLTHLYAADVLNSNELPNNWHLWSSDLADEVTTLTKNFLTKLTNRSSLPDHALLISNMSTRKGGLGLQHPRCVAIPAMILSVKRNTQHKVSGLGIPRAQYNYQPPSFPSPSQRD